ncbi:MAG: HigA family addiction module antitoxin [Candidatus Eremiobacteraeota bacterium]|nr:HigA family addiction module antitoxin [Candidatus Eremiobacteraeota bacterium]
METHMKLRSQTTTSLKGKAGCSDYTQLTARRLPGLRAPTHPGEMLLEEFLKPLDITQSEFARHLGVSFPRLNEIIRGKRGVTPDTALRLERVLGMSADFWLRLQLDWDLWHAKRGKNAEDIGRLVPVRLTIKSSPTKDKKVS